MKSLPFCLLPFIITVCFIPTGSSLHIFTDINLEASAAEHHWKGEPADHQSDSTSIQMARSRAEKLWENLNLPGLSISVSFGDNVLWAEDFGYSDVTNQVPIDPQSTAFRIGSLSKLLTAVAAVKLHEQGDLDLHAPIERYLPDLPSPLSRVTAYQLAGHLGGIRHYGRDEYINTTSYDNIDQTISKFTDDSLISEPGTGYSYSSYGYNLLGAVIQAAAEQEFRQYIHQHLLMPLDMEHTFAEHGEMDMGNPATLYSRDQNDNYQPAYPNDLSDRWPSGGFWSTSKDLARFGREILNDDFLDPESRALLFKEQHTIDGEGIGVGMGWRIGTDSRGRRFYHHGGDSMGGRAFILIYPEQNIVVTMLSNLSYAGFAEDEAMNIAEPFLNE